MDGLASIGYGNLFPYGGRGDKRSASKASAALVRKAITCVADKWRSSELEKPGQPSTTWFLRPHWAKLSMRNL